MKKIIFITIVIIGGSALIQACSSSAFPYNASLGEQVEFCFSLYDQGRYNDAARYLNKVSLYTRATPVEEKVFFYLGMANFKDDNFQAAIEGFRGVFKSSTTSSYKRQALFMIGYCYYKLSPSHSRDASATAYAIQQLQSFIDNYPPADSADVVVNLNELRGIMGEIKDDSLRYARYKDAEADLIAKLNHLDTIKLAEDYIHELRNRLARKTYDAAKLYSNVTRYRAAELYYDEVITKYGDTDYFEPSLIGKIYAQIEQKKWREALLSIEKFEKSFPNDKEKIESIEPYRKMALYGLEHEQEEHAEIIKREKEQADPMIMSND